MDQDDQMAPESSPPVRHRRGLWRRDDGAALVEYVLLIVAIALAIFAGMRLLGSAVDDRISETECELESDTSGACP